MLLRIDAMVSRGELEVVRHEDANENCMRMKLLMRELEI
jgi:hypothetical protein